MAWSSKNNFKFKRVHLSFSKNTRRATYFCEILLHQLSILVGIPFHPLQSTDENMLQFS